MLTECQNPLQCAVIHELKGEISDVKSQLADIYSKVNSIFQAFVNNTGATIQPETSELPVYEVVPTSNSHSEPSIETQLNSLFSVEQIPNFDLNIDINQSNQPFEPNSTEIRSVAVKSEPLDIESFHFDIPGCSKEDFITEHVEGKNGNCAKTNNSLSKSTVSNSPQIAQSCFSKDNHDSSQTSQYKQSKKKASNCNNDKSRTRVERRIYCRSCNFGVCRGSWLQHVAGRHLSTPALTCNVCGFTSKWMKGNMNKHFAKIHPNQKVQFTDRREEFKLELQKMAQSLICG